MLGKSEDSRNQWTVPPSSGCGTPVARISLCGGAAAFLLLAPAVIFPVAAHASPCSERIAVLETAENDLKTALHAPQSVAAQLHHQPTPEAVADAESRAKIEKLDGVLAAARKLDAQGKEAECLTFLQKAGLDTNVR
jgi:hypothetical protein